MASQINAPIEDQVYFISLLILCTASSRWIGDTIGDFNFFLLSLPDMSLTNSGGVKVHSFVQRMVPLLSCWPQEKWVKITISLRQLEDNFRFLENKNYTLSMNTVT